MRKPSEMLIEYEKSYFFRAIVQAVPYGGSVDTLLAGRAVEIIKRRLEELMSNLSERLDVMDQSVIRHGYLASEEFFDLLRSAVEVVIKCSDEGKRQLVADFLVGDVINPEPNDLSFQVVEDLRVLQPFHLAVLKEMPDGEGVGVNRLNPPELLHKMEAAVYQKAISDLERLGFVRYDEAGIGTFGGGSGKWVTTPYLGVFRRAITGMPGATWGNEKGLDEFFEPEA